MKSLLFMGVATFIGTAGALVKNPFLGVLVYYTFAVLRPQFLWRYVLPEMRWSMMVAAATIIAFAIKRRPPLPPRPDGSPARPSGHVHRQILLFALWICMSFAFANTHEGWPKIVFTDFMKIFVMFFIASRLIREVNQLWAIMAATGISLGYIAFEVNMLYLSQGFINIDKEGYAGLDNNGAGLMLAIGVPLNIFLWEGTRGRIRWLYAALIPVIAHAVMMTYSRGAMLSLVVAGPIIYLSSRNKKVMTVGAFCALLAIPIMAGEEIRARFETTADYEEDNSAQQRFLAWSVFYRIANDYPFFGAGPRNADLLSFEYGADEEGRACHNTYLQIAADEGYPGLLLYLLMLAFVWREASRVRARFREADDDEGIRVHSIAAASRCALIVWCAGSTFLSLEAFELPYILYLLGGQVAVLADNGLTATEEEEAPEAPQLAPAAGRRLIGLSKA